MAHARGERTGPLVSVLMSTRNRAARLGGAVESVLAQDHDDIELVIVDDASDDDTRSVLAAWADDPRFRVLHNRTNRGLPASLNRAATASRGAFLARIDDDDRWTEPAKLTDQLAWFRANERGVLVGTAYRDEWGRAIANPAADVDIRRQMLSRCPFCHSSVLFRRDAFEAAGGYDESLPYAEDWELWMRMGRLGSMGNLETQCVEKAGGEDTLSRQFFERQLHMASALVERHADAYPRAFRSRWLHRFNRQFFRWFPVGGRAHRFMSAAFRRRFRLERLG